MVRKSRKSKECIKLEALGEYRLPWLRQINILMLPAYPNPSKLILHVDYDMLQLRNISGLDIFSLHRLSNFLNSLLMINYLD